MTKIRRNNKVVAIILATVILSTSIPLSIWGFGEKSTTTMDNASSQDKIIASEISNETGFSVEEVFQFKSRGLTWNQVLTKLKNRSNLGANSEKNSRDELLLNSGLSEEFVARLKKEDFSEQDITEVKLIEERVAFQLEEIISSNQEGQVTQTNIEKPQADVSSSLRTDDISVYEELSKEINAEDAVYFMLKLKNDFGSYEKVFDEYLYSLQADLNLNDYIKDKNAYKKSKDEKKLLIDDQKVITLEKIEEKAIEKTQKENEESEASTAQSKNTSDTEASGITSQENTPLPDVPNPNKDDVKPQNPTDEIMNEINEINPLKNN